MQLIFLQMTSRKQFKHLTILSHLGSHISEVHFSTVLWISLSNNNNKKKLCIFRQNNLKAFKTFSLFRKHACCSSFCFKKCRKNSVMRGSFVKNEEARWWSTSDLDTKLLSLQICLYLTRKCGYRVFEGYFFIIKWFVNLISQYKTLHITFFFFLIKVLQLNTKSPKKTGKNWGISETTALNCITIHEDEK